MEEKEEGNKEDVQGEERQNDLDNSIGNQSNIDDKSKKGDDNQTLQAHQRTSLGQELFLQKKHQLQILLETLTLNERLAFPYNTRYRPNTKNIFLLLRQSKTKNQPNKSDQIQTEQSKPTHNSTVNSPLQLTQYLNQLETRFKSTAVQQSQEESLVPSDLW